MRILILFTIAVSLFACSNSTNQEAKEIPQVYIEGEAQGTTYHIKYIDNGQINFKKEIDSILIAIDNSVSTYLSTSLISQLNNDVDTVLVDSIFKAVFLKSIEISEATNNALDVTLAPVINAYGWGFKNRSTI